MKNKIFENIKNLSNTKEELENFYKIDIVSIKKEAYNSEEYFILKIKSNENSCFINELIKIREEYVYKEILNIWRE